MHNDDNHALHRDLVALEAEWRARGYFESALHLVLLDLLLIGVFTVASWHMSAQRPVLGGAVLGLAMHQMMSHAHTYGHNAGVWRQELWTYPTLHKVVGYAMTNVFIGIDVVSWQHKHTMHHRHTMSDADEQIRNGASCFPLFSSSPDSLTTRIAERPLEGLLLRWQEFTWLPVLLLAEKPHLWKEQLRDRARDQCAAFTDTR